MYRVVGACTEAVEAFDASAPFLLSRPVSRDTSDWLQGPEGLAL